MQEDVGECEGHVRIRNGDEDGPCCGLFESNAAGKEHPVS